MSALKRLGIWPDVEKGELRSGGQTQTEQAFSFKWARRDSYESPSFQAATKDWLYERYCGGNPEVLKKWLGGEGKIILDAGCGAGNAALLFFGDHLQTNDYLGVDISNAVEVARVRFREAGMPGDFMRADLMRIPIPDRSVDILFSEGVMHHTDDTEKAFHALAKKVKPGGLFLFYVYAKKAVVREFTDDHIRAMLSHKTDEDAWEALLPLTRLGISLGKLNATINIPDDVPYLGIKQGIYDLQRFVYWNFCKIYYRSDFSEDEMNHVNFDWFRPLNCHRHTPEQVRNWCERDSFKVERFDVQESGISVVAIAPDINK